MTPDVLAGNPFPLGIKEFPQARGGWKQSGRVTQCVNQLGNHINSSPFTIAQVKK